MLVDSDDALNKSALVQVSEAWDADLHAANLTNWQQEYDQTSKGGFYGSIVELPFNKLQVFKEHTSQALQQKCLVWPDSVWLGIPLQGQADSRINGLTISEGSIMCRPGGCDFGLSTPQHYDLFGLVVDQHALLKMANIQGLKLNWAELTQHGRLNLPEKTLKDVRFLLTRMLSTVNAKNTSSMHYDIVMMALLEILKLETPLPARTQTFHHRKKVVDITCDFLADNLDCPLTVTQLCEVANVSRRTLQYSFESILGISPIQYLRMSRLNGVRRQLLNTSDETLVSDVASQWGFWHLSQFAKDYKQLFGERPSQTLGSKRS